MEIVVVGLCALTVTSERRIEENVRGHSRVYGSFLSTHDLVVLTNDDL